MSLFFLFFGLIIWSFVNALVWRIKNKKTFVSDRSECTSCWHKLWVLDLVPFFSWVFLWWKCRYCNDKISIRYPLIELIFWLSYFFISYFLFPDFSNITTESLISFFLILFLTSVFLIISIYDILYLEILDSLAIPTTFIFIILSFTEYWFVTFIDWFLWALLIYTFLYLQILIPWLLYTFEKKKFKDMFSLFVSYFIFPVWMFFRLFISEEELNKVKIFKQTEDELPAWVGGWDLRFAILMWFVLWWKLTIIWVFASYMVWALFSVFIIFIWKVKNREIKNEVPFIPFLVIWTLFAFFFWDYALALYIDYLNSV